LGTFPIKGLWVEFSSEEWRSKFRKANYIFTCTDVDGSANQRPCKVPTRVNLALALSPHVKAKDFKETTFRYEMLPGPTRLDSIRYASELLPEEWSELRDICQAIRRAEESDIFLDEETEQILSAREYNLMNDIQEQGDRADFVIAFTSLLKMAIDDSDEVLEVMLRDVAQEHKRNDKFVDYVKEKKNQGQDLRTIVKRFLRKETRLIQADAPDLLTSVVDLIEKVRSTETVIIRPKVSDPAPTRPNNKRKRYAYTEEEEEAIWEGLQIYGSTSAVKIQERFGSILGHLTLQQVKNKIKNMQRNESVEIQSQTTTRMERMWFTLDEDNAILNGIAMHGKGNYVNWKAIKNDPKYGPILARRSIDVIRKRYEKLRNSPPAIRIL
jgi:hypothetical protein